jgi:purine nucleosidase
MKKLGLTLALLGAHCLQAQDPVELMRKLSAVPKMAEVVIDTDAYNEVDDQFAIAYAILAKDKMNVQAIYAAPFINKRAKNVEEGMVKSYDEILNILGKMKVKYPVYKGSTVFMKDKKTPVISDAANDLIDRAMKAKEPLYVLALGAPTNVASALIMKPEIKDKIVLIWLGGKGLHANTAREYNLMQDMPASQILFDSGVPMVQIPTEPVTSHLSTTVAELKANIGGANALSDYLIEIVKGYSDDHFAWSKVIWDIAVIAAITDPSALTYEYRSAPILTDQQTYSFDGTRHMYKVATYINRNKVFRDMFTRFKALKD